jgi:hypothetical protein
MTPARRDGILPHSRIRALLAAACGVALLATSGPAAAEPAAGVKVLFDFESPAEIAAFSPLSLPDARPVEPAPRIEASAQHAAAGRQSLKITFAGGRWPTITTKAVPGDWMSYQTFRADVVVSRPCLVGFAAIQEKSSRARGWDGSVSRWVKTQLCRPGRNEVSAVLHPPNDYSISRKLGAVVSFEIFMYAPHEGESIHVDNIRLLEAKEAGRTPTGPATAPTA